MYTRRHLLSLAPSAAARIEVATVLVAHLPARPAAAVLPPLDEARVPVDAHDPVVELAAVNVAHRVLRVGAAKVLDEAEAAGRLRVAVQAHDDLLDGARARAQGVDLRLGRVEAQVADVDRRRPVERRDLVLVGREELAIDVYFLRIGRFVVPERGAGAEAPRFW